MGQIDFFLLGKIEAGVEVFVIMTASSIFREVKFLMRDIVVTVVEAVEGVVVAAAVEGGSRKWRRRTLGRSIR